MSDYKITDAQKEYLKSLICERISADEANRQIIENFRDPYGSTGITSHLQKGWNADKTDKLAYYIVKEPKSPDYPAGRPLFFFSLKCGEMHMSLVPENLNKTVENSLMLLKVASASSRKTIFPMSDNPWEMLYLWRLARDAMHRAQEVEVEDWAKDVIAKQLVNGSLPEEAWGKLWTRVFKSLGKKNSYDDEVEMEGNNIIRTQKTFPAVSLEHFCAHEGAKEIWKAKGMPPKSLGKSVFWFFIEPIIQSLRELVGCEYIYLFAAQGGETKFGKLTRLYQELGFEFRDDIYVTKPQYDFQCYFMCQKVTSLKTGLRAFRKNFNEPKKG